MKLTLVLVLVVLLFICLFTVSWYSNNGMQKSSNSFEPMSPHELSDFEQWFKFTLNYVFAQKAEKIVNPTRNWNSETVFDDLDPWTSVTDFGIVCHTLIGYCVRYNNSADGLHRSPELANNLIGGLRAICDHLPDPPTYQQTPWGTAADWYHFTISMPEVFMNVTIVLNNTPYYEEAAALTRYWLALYLPTAVDSMGWHRTAGDAIRMGVPYAYSQLLRGYLTKQIVQEPSMRETMQTISFPHVATGNGLHLDSIYIDHNDVRAYQLLINSFFTFAYYTRLFGADVINTEGITRAIKNVGSPEGVVVPGVMSRNGTLYSDVIGNFVDYPIAVHSADLSKVLTKLSKSYYGAMVGATTRLAYYEADPINNTQAPLWTMTRRIWNRRAKVIDYNATTVRFETGIILQSLNGIMPVPSTTTSTQSFRPTVGKTALAKTRTAGAALVHAHFAEMNNLQFKSCTLFYNNGMFQLYYNIGVEPDSLNNINGRVVVLSRDTSVDTGDLPFETQRINNNGTSSGSVFNGIVCRRVPITNFNIPSLTVRSPSVNVELIEQVLNLNDMYTASAISSFKLNVEDYSDDLRAFRIDMGEAVYVNTNMGVKALFAYPWLLLKEDTTIVFMSVNEELIIPINVINDSLNSISEPNLQYLPVNCYLYGNGFKLKDSLSNLQFIFNIVN